ncbi:MAG: hypothetical protein WBV11_02910 [Salegentibacter sp.]
MEIKELRGKKNIPRKKDQYAYFYFDQYLQELQKQDLPEEILERINPDIDRINKIPSTERSLAHEIKRCQKRIVKLIEQELEIVPKNYYQKLWLVYGMAFFGFPIGLVITSMIGNFGLLSFGLGTGMALGLVTGITIGKRLDKKAFEEGRQLDAELRL